jgi:hypothetical protein
MMLHTAPDDVALKHAGRHFQNVDELSSAAPRVPETNKHKFSVE